MHVQPYLFFEGQAEEAIEYYRKTIGAETGMMMRFKEGPEPGHIPPGAEDKIMHAEFKVGDTTVMVSDGQCKGPAEFKGFALSITVSSDAEVDRIHAALAKDGQIVMPAGKTFFASRFGMVTDQFGVMWMVIALP